MASWVQVEDHVRDTACVTTSWVLGHMSIHLGLGLKITTYHDCYWFLLESCDWIWNWIYFNQALRVEFICLQYINVDLSSKINSSIKTITIYIPRKPNKDSKTVKFSTRTWLQLYSQCKLWNIFGLYNMKIILIFDIIQLQ